MEKPILKLSSKQFLTGLANGAHLGTGGILYKADGITPLFEAGTAQSPNNGLLMPGAAATTIAGTITGNIIAATQYTNASNTTLYFLGSDNHIYSLVLNSTLSNTIADIHTATALRHGFEHFVVKNGANMLFYFQNGYIGRFDLNVTWNDNWATLSSDDIHCAHRFFDRILFGNSGYVGQIVDDGTTDLSSSSASNLNKTVLNINTKGRATDISDDGIYAVIATTRNLTCDTNALAGSAIIFWDGYSSSWNREYQIPDPFIFALEHTPIGVFAFGVTGIWQVSYGAEPKKIFAIPTGIYSVNTSSALQYGRAAASHFANAVLWGGSSGSNKAIKTFGKLDISAPNAYLHPFLSTASKNITFVDGQLAKGYVLVGDDTPQLKAYPFSTANNPQAGNTAQTVYFSLPSKVAITRIDLVFGEPLVSGDAISAGIFTDEDTAVIPFGSVTFTADGARYRKTLIKSATCEDQLSVLLTFTSGSVKLKAVEVYGTIETP